MRHYEIVFLVHPDQSDQVPAMVKKYSGIISSKVGKFIEKKIGAEDSLLILSINS